MTNQNIINQLQGYKEHRQASKDCAYDRMVQQQTVQDLIRELSDEEE